MPLTLTLARIKEKCGISDTTYDTTIDNLIAEFIPVLEYAIEPNYLADLGLLPTLDLGATEVLCGEFLSQLAREPGASEGFSFLGLEVFGRKTAQDAESMKAQGAARLAPYLRTPSTIVALTGKGETQ